MRHPSAIQLEALAAGDTAAVAALHVGGCGRCAAYVAKLRESAAAFREGSAPEDFLRKVRARFPSILALFFGSLAFLGARAALAADPPCALAVQADASLQQRWPGLLDGVRRAFAAREDVDSCARIELTTEGGSVRIRVVLLDGRAASRSVARREDVMPTLEALLLLPARPVEPTPPSSADQASASVPPSQPPVAIDASLLAPTIGARDLPTAGPRPGSNAQDHLRIELSVVTDARIGDGQTSFGLGALSFLDLGGWIAGFGGRADRYERLAGGASGAALELGAFGGRRFGLKGLALDLYGGPGIALRGGGTTTTSTTGGNTSTQSSIGVVPRGLLAARINFAPGKTLHTFVGVEGELGPASPLDSAAASGAALPIWAFGLALGATVGTQ